LTGPPQSVRSGAILSDILEGHGRARADHPALLFLERGEAVTARLTYGELMAAAGALAGGLHDTGLAGVPVVLALPPGPGFVIALLACLRAGAIAVPVPFPAAGEARARLEGILADLGGGAVLAEPGATLDSRRLRRLDPMALAASGPAPSRPSPDAPAVIQYSSGSTQAPRGIVISQANIIANQAMIGEIFQSTPASVVVNWLPPHHDMGLFGALLYPLFAGATTVLMPPFAFIQNPRRWLEAISRHRGTVAGAPNFGFDLCVRRVPAERVDGLDLSTLEVAFCGSEPIRTESLRRFAGRFAAAGFDPSIFLPCYGLAEATLLVTSVSKGVGVREVALGEAHDERRHVSCGHAPAGCHVTIRDPDSGLELPPPAVGEICVSGPHVAIGVWDGGTQTVAPLPGIAGAGADRRLHTGDVGALTSAGLVVLDRIKDIVIVRGRNIYATDVEAVAFGVAQGVVPAAATFAVHEADVERLVLVCEIAVKERGATDLVRLRQMLSEAVGQSCGFVPTVEFVAFGALPRTTSGKVRRQAARRLFIEGGLKLLKAEGATWASV